MVGLVPWGRNHPRIKENLSGGVGLVCVLECGISEGAAPLRIALAHRCCTTSRLSEGQPSVMHPLRGENVLRGFGLHVARRDSLMVSGLTFRSLPTATNDLPELKGGNLAVGYECLAVVLPNRKAIHDDENSNAPN
jgi:hypothetical protein